MIPKLKPVDVVVVGAGVSLTCPMNVSEEGPLFRSLVDSASRVRDQLMLEQQGLCDDRTAQFKTLCLADLTGDRARAAEARNVNGMGARAAGNDDSKAFWRWTDRQHRIRQNVAQLSAARDLRSLHIN